MTDAGKGFVYGLHAFSAENQDEISFGPGEQVVVLEKDDQYGDGWWQVSLLALSLSKLSIDGAGQRSRGGGER